MGMDFKKVSDHLRKETTPLAVSQLVIISDQGDFDGFGKLRRDGDGIVLEVTLEGNKELPAVGGIITREKFWKIGGIIENQVPFWGTSVPQQHTTQQIPFLVYGAQFSFDRIHHLKAEGSIREAVMLAASAQPPESPMHGRGRADAYFTNYKMVWREEMTITVEQNPFLGESSHTERNTLCGEVGDYEYGLVQRGPDCGLHLRLKKDAMATAAEITQMAQAFYRALAFVHGRHTWPQWERIDGPEGRFSEYATGPRAFSDNIHIPISERTCQHGSDAKAFISKAVECFLRQDAFSKAFDDYLFLTREAAARDTPKHVGTLGICAVFEGFVGFLHKEFCGENEALKDVEFEEAKAVLIEFAKQRVGGPDATAWMRFVGLLHSARALRPADKFEQLVAHFRLPAEKMKPALDAWKAHRHPLAHGASADDPMDQMLATSQIAGAINVLAAAALGYTGVMILSRIDDKFIDLP